MEVASVVLKLKELAAEETNRVAILQDKGCLPGLKLFLANENPKVITMALETLKYLSMEVKNQPLMLKDREIIVKIKHIIETDTTSKEQKVLAAEIFKNILPKPASNSSNSTVTDSTTANNTTSTSNDSSKENNSNVSNKTKTQSGSNSLKTRSGSNKTIERRKSIGRNKRRGNSKWSTSHNKDSYSISLYIPNVEQAKRDVEIGLLMVKGVISFTFDVKKDICVVRSSKEITPDILYKGINEQNSDLKPKQLVKGDTGEMNKYVEIIGPDFKGEEVMDDGYVDEDNNEYEKEFNANTLAKLNEDTQSSGSWFGSVGNYIAKSLYW